MYTDYVDENESNDQNDYYDDDNNSSSSNDNKDKIKKIAFIAIIFCVLLIIIVLVAKGCSNSNNKDRNHDYSGTAAIVISHKNLTLEVGEQVNLNADVLNTKEANPVVIWMSDDTEIADVTDDGVVTANKEGSTIIRASYGDIQEECSIVVTSNASEIQSIKIVQGNFTLKKGEGTLLQIETSPENAKTENLIYSTDDSSVATVSDIGYVNGIDVGTTTITVKTASGLSTSATVTVTGTGSTSIEPTSIQIYGLSKELVVGGTAEVIFDIFPTNATNKNVTWSSSDPSVASVNANNVITGHKAGTCTITASTANNITARYDVTVHSSNIAVTGVTVTNGDTYNMKVGYVKRIQYSVEPSNATNQKVKFSSSNPSVAAVDDNGLVAANKEGNAIITLTTEDGNKTAIISVVVTSSSGSPTSDSPSDSSGGSTGGESGGSTGGSTGGSGSDGSGTSSCLANSMITVTNNQKSDGAVVSSISFANASPYTNSSKAASIEVVQLSDCASSYKYKTYYGTTQNNVSTQVMSGIITKTGFSINFFKSGDTSDGYYKTVITATDNKTGATLTKTYYAIVKFGSSVSSDPKISLSQDSFTASASTARVTVTATSNYGLTSIRYCKSNLQTGCPPDTPKTLNNNATYKETLTFTGVKVGYSVCAVAYNNKGNVSDKVCILINRH